MELHSDPDTLAQRIVYALSWRLTSGLAYPEIATRDGTQVPILSIRSALTIVERNVDASWLAGRVVVIGGSFAENRDRYATPLGEMPGSIVLINAVHSLQQYGELSAPPFYVKIIVEIILIIVMSVAFALFDSFWGMLLSGAFIILALLPVSFLGFRYGVWLDFAIPLVAVQLNQMAKEFKESRNRRGREPNHDVANPMAIDRDTLDTR